MRLFGKRKRPPANPPEAAVPAPLPRFPGLRLGAGSSIDPTAQILGWSDVEIGENCVVSEGCWLNTNDRSRREIQISIGHGSLLGRRGFVGSGRLIEIGPYFLSGPDCKIVCSDHVIDDPFVPYCASGAEITASIRIGCNVWLGGGVNVVGEVSIGCGSIVGTGSIVLDDIPPFAIAVGAPARVVKRYDVAARRWVSIREWTGEMQARLPTEAEYLAHLEAKWGGFAPPRQAAGHAAGDLP